MGVEKGNVKEEEEQQGMKELAWDGALPSFTRVTALNSREGEGKLAQKALGCAGSSMGGQEVRWDFSARRWGWRRDPCS